MGKKVDPFKGTVVLIGAASAFIFYKEMCEKPYREPHHYSHTGQAIVGKTIDLKDSTKVYSSFTDAVQEINTVGYVQNLEQKLVINAWYEYNATIIQISGMNNTGINEENIIQEGAKLLAVQTDSYEYYNVEDIKVKDLIKIKRYE